MVSTTMALGGVITSVITHAIATELTETHTEGQCHSVKAIALLPALFYHLIHYFGYLKKENRIAMGIPRA